MATTENIVLGNGGDTYSFSFPYLKIEDVQVELQEYDTVNNIIVSNLKVSNFTIPSGNPTTIIFNDIGADTIYQTAPNGDVRDTSYPNGYQVRIRIFRSTNIDATPSTFFAGSAIRAQDLNTNFEQILNRLQEGDFSTNVDMNNNLIRNLATPTVGGDAANKSYVDTLDDLQKDYIDARLGDLEIPGFTRWRKVATAGQTVFSGAGDYGGTLSYSAIREQVFLNGAQLQRDVDYTANTGTSITLTTGAVVGDIVEVICVNNLNSSTSNQSQDLFFVQSGTGATTRTVESKLRDVVSVTDFGADPTGAADSTAAFNLFLSAGGGFVPSGTYSITSLNITYPVDVRCHQDATLKKRDTGLNPVVKFSAGSEGSFWRGGKFDGNTALWTGWTFPGDFNDWQAINVATRDITLTSITFKNWTNHPLVGAGDYLVAKSLTFDACATGPLFGWPNVSNNTTRPTDASGIGQLVDGLTFRNCGNVGKAGTLQHAIDTYGCKSSTYRNISIVGFDSAADGLSYAISGLTDKLSEGCVFESIIFDSPISDVKQHLAVSLLGTRNSSVSNVTATNFAGLAFEVLSCYGCSFSNVLVDFKYRVTSFAPLTSSKGLSIDTGSYGTDGQGARDILGSRINTFTACTFRNGGLGADIKSDGATFNGCTFTGFLISGIAVNLTTNAQFPGATPKAPTNLHFDNCVAEWNGGAGLNVANSRIVSVNGGSYSNNGQNSTASSTSRSGVVAVAASKLSIVNAALDDTQSFASAGGISFIPGSTNASNRYSFAVTKSEGYNEGQYITLVNGGGPAVDLTGQIVELTETLMTLDFGGAATLSSSGNTTALSGTWSGSGTTLTGTGGTAQSEIVGPLYVTNGTQWRKVVKVNNNNSIVISSAFTGGLSGATLTKLTVTANGIPSQQYGARVFGGVTRVLFKGNRASGNVLERSNLSGQTSIEPGSEYWRKTTTTITGSGPTVDVMTGFYTGQRLAGWTSLNTAAITGGGATSLSYLFTDSTGGTTKETLASGLSLSLNQRPRNNAVGVNVANNDKVVATFAGGTPTTGSIVFEAFIKCDLPELLPTV